MKDGQKQNNDFELGGSKIKINERPNTMYDFELCYT